MTDGENGEYDFNALERSAAKLKQVGRWQDALSIYYYMADGDPSLDGGYLGSRIAECHEALGQLLAARYWHARAVEQNPDVRKSSEEALERLKNLNLDELLVSD